MTTSLTTKDFFAQQNVRAKFEEMLGKRSSAFITSVLQIVSSSDLLKGADNASIYNAAAVAATLDLPLNNQLGFAYIVPYKTKQPDGSLKVVAQFLLGYKAYIQLAQRSGQFLTINSKPVYDGQFIQDGSFEGYHFDWKAKKSDLIIGYAAYFKLLNGFEKTLYMTIDELKKHGKQYSQTFKFDKGLWKDNFDVMASKTVLKLLLAKFAPLSVEMQKAVITDQAVINDAESVDVTYVDNGASEPVDKELERIRLMIEDCKTLEELTNIEKDIPLELNDIYIVKRDELILKVNQEGARKGGKK